MALSEATGAVNSAGSVSLLRLGRIGHDPVVGGGIFSPTPGSRWRLVLASCAARVARRVDMAAERCLNACWMAAISAPASGGGYGEADPQAVTAVAYCL